MMFEKKVEESNEKEGDEEEGDEEEGDEESDFKEAVERSKLIYYCIRDRYNLEWDRAKSLDGKATGIISFVGIILALQGGIGAILIKDVPKTGIQFIILNEIFILSIICLTFSILSGLSAYYVQNWKFIPEVNTFIKKCENENISRAAILKSVEEAMAISINTSKKNNEKKVRFILYGFILLVAGLILNLFFIIGLILEVNY